MQSLERSSDRRFHGIMLAILAGFFLFSYILPLGLRDMMRPDEFRYGEIPREMIARGDWTTPLLVGVRYFEKPALGYQWTALCIKIFGENAFAVRLPSALSVGLAALLLYWICAKKSRDRWLAPLAAVLYMSFALVFGVGTFAVLDSQLAMALTWCIGSYYLACESDKLSQKIVWLAVAGLAAGAAFLFKGFLAFAVPVVVIAPYLIWQRQWMKFLTTPWLPLVLAVAVALPWSLAIWKAEPEFWKYFFIEEHIKRFTSGTYDRSPEPFWFFIPILLGGVMPGGLLWIAAWKGVSKAWLKEPLVRFCLCWAIMPFILFSISSCKVGTYILPCFPPLAILTAWAFILALKKIRDKAQVVFDRIVLLLSCIFVPGGLVCAGLMIIWRLKLVDKLPIFDPESFLPLIASLLLSVFGAVCWFLQNREVRMQICILMGAFIVVCAWGAPVVCSNATNPRQMPEKTLRRLYKEWGISDDDIVAVDRGAATSTAWVLRRDDLPVVGRWGEFEYGFNNFPEEYVHRYYEIDDIDRLLKDSGNKRVFFVNIHNKKRKPFPDNWKVKRKKYEQGVTIAELDK